MTVRRILAILLLAALLIPFASCTAKEPTQSALETSEQSTEPAEDPAEAPTEAPTEPPAEEGTTEEMITEEGRTELPEPSFDPASLPKRLNGGRWDTSHVQGIAFDREDGFLYLSFTTVLVKIDLNGNLVGSVVNLIGHLGDLDFNEEDGRVYGSFEFKAKNIFYLAIFDGDSISQIGINGQRTDLLKVVALPDVIDDFTATVGGNDYRYGCSGIDGVAFGPDFGADPNSESRLMVAYGIFKDNGRNDNDHQIILSYDWRKFAPYEKYLNVTSANVEGPRAENRYFIYTGNTNYGVQNLEYDASTGYWFLAVYVGSKTDFPNYALFAVDGRRAPRTGEIVGQPTPETGLLLSLAEDGLSHDSTGIRGWYFAEADTGIVSLGQGYFYICHDAKENGKQTGTAILYRWIGGQTAFEAVA